MIHLKRIFCLVLFMTATSTIQAAEFESNIAITNDYIWRGMTQSNEEPAVSGGFDISADNGMYFGTWGSSIEFGGDTASMELDYYFGISNELESGISYDLGYISFTYPGDDEADFEEIYLGLGYSNFGVTFYSGQDDASDNVEFSLDILDTGLNLTFGDYDQTGKYKILSYDLPVSFLGLSVGIAWSDFESEDGMSDEDGVYITFSM
jgi:uncharacterized protein (TIGR02001 family)